MTRPQPTSGRSLRTLSVFGSAAAKLVLAGFAVVVVGIAVVLGLGLATYKSYAEHFVPPDELAINRPSTGAKIYDRNGQLLYQYVDDKEGLRTPVKLEDVSPAFLAATIATEDSNFFQNPGVNPRGLARATWENFGPLINGDNDDAVLQGTGGSSITQQLIKNVYIPQNERHERSISRKIREIVYSIEMTKRYDKSQILEWYVNQISYGGIYTGVEAAAQGYFAKSAKDLTLAEATLLAGIPQSPAAYDPVTNLESAVGRRNEVISLMEKRGEIQIGQDAFYTANTEELEAARQTPIDIRPQVFPIEAPHFVLTYIAPQLEALVGRDALLHDGLIVTTTLDLNLQHEAQNIVENYVSQFEATSNAHNGAALVIQPSTGEVLAMVGSRDYFRSDVDGQVNNLLALNSPGSSFKPFVYLTSFIKLGWTPATRLVDSPISYREVNGSTFQPQNPTKNSYQGSITIRNSLGNSLNVTAFKTALQVGVPNIVAMAKSMGFTTLDRSYGPAISIGGVDLKGLDLTYGYSVLANSGVMAGQNSFAPEAADLRDINPVAILRIEGRDGEVRYNVDDHRAQKRVAPAVQSYMISDILSDPNAECTTFGCGGLSIPGYKVAVKTGTSEPYDPSGPNAGKIGETWAFGYTPDYTIGVWAGNSNNTPVVNIFSTTISFRAMRDIMLTAYSGRPQTPFPRPEGLPSRVPCAAVANLPSTVTAPVGNQTQPPQLDARAQQLTTTCDTGYGTPAPQTTGNSQPGGNNAQGGNNGNNSNQGNSGNNNQGGNNGNGNGNNNGR